MNKLLDKEIFKDIKNYEKKYQISNLGNIKSLNYKRSNISKLLKFKKNKDFYPTILLSKNNISKRYTIHRLLAIHFIPNPNNYKCVNHIDGNKLNYSLDNLEWCTHSQNTTHAFKIGLMKDPDSRKLKIKKKVINIISGEIYNSIKEVVLLYGFNYSTFTQKLNGIHKNNTNFKHYIENE